VSTWRATARPHSSERCVGIGR